MSSPARSRAFSSPNTTAPAFEMHDLNLVVATKITGLKLLVENRRCYAEEEVVAVTATTGGRSYPKAICSFYRQHGAIRFEWFSNQRHIYVATVEEALCVIHAFAASGQIDTWNGPNWPAAKI